MARPKEKEETQPPVLLSKRASAQIKKALVRERSPDSGMRVLLVNAGNGYRYDLHIEDKAQEEDHISTQGGLKVYVDKFAAQFLEGTQLDYHETPIGSGFLFIRPQEPNE